MYSNLPLPSEEAAAIFPENKTSLKTKQNKKHVLSFFMFSLTYICKLVLY